MNFDELNLDPPIKRLVVALNKIPELSTNSSCAGHKNPKEGQKLWGEFYVDFSVSYTAEGWNALERVATIIDEWHDASSLKLELTIWIDGGLRWNLEGEYIDQEIINDLAEFAEPITDGLLSVRERHELFQECPSRVCEAYEALLKKYNEVTA